MIQVIWYVGAALGTAVVGLVATDFALKRTTGRGLKQHVLETLPDWWARTLVTQIQPWMDRNRRLKVVAWIIRPTARIVDQVMGLLKFFGRTEDGQEILIEEFELDQEELLRMCPQLRRGEPVVLTM
jgi:hypothetical protein